jgi:hypothetical protein
MVVAPFERVDVLGIHEVIRARLNLTVGFGRGERI